MKPILVTSYVNPDLDGVAGITAYSEFLNKKGKIAEAGIFGEPHAEAKYVLHRFNISPPRKLENTEDFDEVILVDASETAHLEGKIPFEKVIEIIDHRKLHESEKFPRAKAQIEFVGAAATLIAEKFMQSSISISRESAILLFAAIISNTINFRGITTERDKEAASWLNKTATLPENFWREIFLAKSDLTGDILRTRIEGDLATFNLANKKVAIGQIEMIGAESLIANRVREIKSIFEDLKKSLDLDFTFLNLIELEEGYNILVAPQHDVQNLLERVLHVTFKDDLARTPTIMMRKEIGPLIKQELERHG